MSLVLSLSFLCFLFLDVKEENRLATEAKAAEPRTRPSMSHAVPKTGGRSTTPVATATIHGGTVSRQETGRSARLQTRQTTESSKAAAIGGGHALISSMAGLPFGIS